MKSSRIFRACYLPLISASAAVAFFCDQAFGQAISLYTTTDQSVINASTGSITDSENVNSLPYSTALTSTYIGTASGTVVTPNLSTGSLSFDFDSSISGRPSTSGEGSIYFTALVNATYTISGNLTATGSGTTGEELSAQLNDLATPGTYLYQYDVVDGGSIGSTSHTLDTSFGYSLTGTLIAGHNYEFDAYDASEETSAESLSGNTTITLLNPVPEPSTWAFIFVGIGLFTGLNRTRKAAAQV